MKRIIFEKEKLDELREQLNAEQVQDMENSNPLIGGLGFLGAMLGTSLTGNSDGENENINEIVEREENIVDVEYEENEEGKEIDSEKVGLGEDNRILVSAVPLLLNSYVENICCLEMLCETKAGDLFIGICQFVLEYDIEYDMIKDFFQFSDLSSFIGQKIGLSMLKLHLPVYLLDLEFSLPEKDGKIESYLPIIENFYTKGIRKYEDGSTGIIEEFSVNSNLFATLKFFTDSIESFNANKRAITVATTAGYKCPEGFKYPEVILVDNVDIIINMAKSDFEDTTAIVEFRFFDTTKESYTLLTSFDVGKKVTRKMTKGCTSKKIERSYMIDEDQYVDIFSFATNFSNLDKTYMVVKAKNKKDDVKLFFFDNINIEKIIELIGQR